MLLHYVPIAKYAGHRYECNSNNCFIIDNIESTQSNLINVTGVAGHSGTPTHPTISTLYIRDKG